MNRPEFLPPEGYGPQQPPTGPGMVPPPAGPSNPGAAGPPPSYGRPPSGPPPGPPYGPPPSRGGRGSSGLIIGAVALAVVLILGGVLFAALKNREPSGVSPIETPSVGPSEPDPTEPTPMPSESTSEDPGINPGYDPVEDPDKPFHQPRASRPPVAHPTATPEQTWPTFPPPEGELTGWIEVDGEERGSAKVPEGWVSEEGMAGYESMHDLMVMRYLALDRPGQCEGKEFGLVGMMLPAEGGTPMRVAGGDVTRWAQMRNTEWEGDYYAVPEPEIEAFTFDNGNEGALATITFVPMYPHDYSCNTPATRLTVVAQESGGKVYRMVTVAHIGLPESLPVEHERRILATFDVPG